MTSSQQVLDSINRSLSEIVVADDGHYLWDSPRRFSDYAGRLQLVLNHLFRSCLPENLPPSVHTSLKGIAGDLTKALDCLSVYAGKSKIYVLINCQSLCASLQECTVSIGEWLALLDSAIHDFPELWKKITDLSKDMKLAQFRVTENEERVHQDLEKEGSGRQSSKVAQSAIVMDLARALGIELNNHVEFSNQVKLLKNDLADSCSVSESLILSSLESIVNSWSIDSAVLTQKLGLDIEEDVHISPFMNFLCPLTKEVMKDPVVLVTSQTYERAAIKHWFDRCLEDGRQPTCPVTGEILESLELKPNIGLAGAIKEWVNRNIDIHVELSVQCLKKNPPSMDSVEMVLDSVYRISEKSPAARYRVRNAGIVDLIVKFLRNCSKSIGSHLRSKAFLALLSMAKDEESKSKMLEGGITRFAIHGLCGSSEKEREYAVKLLLEFSYDEAFCAKIAFEKGALVLLSTMADDAEYPTLSKLAAEVLKLMERVEDNIPYLAAAGRFDPLLGWLCEGTDDIKIEMASMLGRMALTNSSKEKVARRSAKVLVDLLYNPVGREASLQALNNLSSLNDNVTILVDCAILPALVDVLFENYPIPIEQKEFAASIIANVVSTPGYWEFTSVDKESHSMQSESIITGLLGILSIASPRCQVSILRILYGIASSPHAAESVLAHIKSGNGIENIVNCLEHPEFDYRIYAFKLTRLLSERLGEDMAIQLTTSNKLPLFKDKILNNQCTEGERSDAACILAHLPLSENEVNAILEPGFVKWIVSFLKDQKGRTDRPTSVMVEGLIGLLLHVAKSPHHQFIVTIKENEILTVLHDWLVLTSKPKVKELAACGLKYLSETGRAIGWVESEPEPPKGLCSFLFFCGRPSTSPSTCPIHNTPCEEDSQFCLLKGKCIKPLVDLLSDEDANVQIAAVDALSTLVMDSSDEFKRTVDELEQMGVADAVIQLLTQARPGVLQEKVIWMVERMLRAENLAQRHSLNQAMVKALVEAFKHGSGFAKLHAQQALTSLKEISGFSGKSSSQNHERR